MMSSSQLRGIACRAGVVSLALGLALTWGTAADGAEAKPVAAVPANVENAVVKVFSTLRYPDPFKPWTKQAPTEVTASGVVIDGKRILTNAHVVLYSSQVHNSGQPGRRQASRSMRPSTPATVADRPSPPTR